MSDPRGAVIADALAGRLAAVEQRLVGLPAAGEFRASEIGDLEETLRILMVRLFPRVRRRHVDAGVLEALLSSLAAIAPAAASPDLRFLDAWNNVYEVLFEDGRGRMLTPAQAARLLSGYTEILRAQLGRLERSRISGT